MQHLASSSAWRTLIPPRTPRLLGAALVLVLAATLGCGATHSPAGDGGGPPDAPSLLDASRPTDCDAMRVTAAPCRAACDGPPAWYWVGERCARFGCGECVGEDCGLGANSEAACRAAHAGCEPELCRSTGGQWLFWVEECDHYQCGVPVPATCLSGAPVCDCGAGQSFVRGEGCRPDVACLEPRPTAESLCRSTGGTWENVCCPSRCGVPCSAECLAPACTCGPLQIFDEARGCVDAAECRDQRAAGQSCSLGTDSLRCADDLICCQSCGGAGCSGEPTCREPVCDSTGTLDICGNTPLSP